MKNSVNSVLLCILSKRAGVSSKSVKSTLITTLLITIGFPLLSQTPSYQWVKNIGSTSSNLTSRGLDLAVDGSGNVHVTGFFSGTADFDPGIGTSNITSAGSNDIFIVKCNASGNFLWAQAIGGTAAEQVQAIALDGSGNIYISGTFGGTVDFDPGTGVTNLISNGPGDAFIAKYTAAGLFSWAFNIGGVGSDFAQDII